MSAPYDHQDLDGFRREGHRLVDWVADYLEGVEHRPAKPDVEPGWVRSKLPPSPPATPEPWDDIVADLDRIVVPATVHWQSPNFFGYFPANASPPSILGDLVSSGLGVQGMLWATGPACTELEAHVCDWMVELLGLPDRFRSDGDGDGGGVIQDSASSATLTAVVVAREQATGGDPTVIPRLRAYTSAEAHSSVEKGVRVAGLAADQLRLVPTTDDHAMDPAALRRMILDDLAAGLVPFLVVATVGTTSSGAIDPVAAVADVLDGLLVPLRPWLHVDAAWAGTAAVVPELRARLNDGVEQADSWCTDPHKWLLTNFDCDLFFVADRAALLGALSVLPEYLRNDASDAGAVLDYRDWHVPLGRRFRALKLWFVVRRYGADGLAEVLRGHVALAAGLAERVAAHPRLELAAPAPLGLVCLRHVDGDDATRRLIDAVLASGALVTHTRLDQRLVLRVSIGQTSVEARHVDALWTALAAAA